MRDKAEIEAWFDGGCRGNPGGLATFGAVICKNGETIWEHARTVKPIRVSTSNLAEYAGYYAVLNELLRRKWTEYSITVFGDSQMVINQMKRKWRIHPIKPYAPLARKALRLTAEFSKLKLKWIPMEENKLADSLASKGSFSDGIICTPCIVFHDPRRTCNCDCHKVASASCMSDFDATALFKSSVQDLAYLSENA